MTTGIPAIAQDAARGHEFIYPGKSRILPAGLFAGAGYGNNTGLSGPRSAVWLS